MAKNNNRRDRGLEDEARDYVSGLPDETAAGRLVDDEGSPMQGWRADTDEPQERGQGASVKGDPNAPRAKRNNQNR
ncbi:MAG TPA: hypothetical protein VKB69_11570 [Micromonosporaceae bacterium]|nr:hypothetical protein [Micromonosporaceae bacterium]